MSYIFSFFRVFPRSLYQNKPHHDSDHGLRRLCASNCLPFVLREEHTDCSASSENVVACPCHCGSTRVHLRCKRNKMGREPGVQPSVSTRSWCCSDGISDFGRWCRLIDGCCEQVARRKDFLYYFAIASHIMALSCVISHRGLGITRHLRGPSEMTSYSDTHPRVGHFQMS